MPTVLVTGANRGLGLEFVRQYAADGWRVLACCRRPDEATDLRQLAGPQVTLHALDVTDHPGIDRLAAQLRGQTVDLLLNNAGIYGPRKMVLGQIDYATWDEVFRVNTMGPAKLVEAFVEHVAASALKQIACVSSQMGSVALNHSGRHYLYRSTKAALNAVVKSLAIDLAPRGVTVVTLHPGWVRTDMGGPDADLSPEESVSALRAVLGKLKLSDSGKFFGYDGRELPW